MLLDPRAWPAPFHALIAITTYATSSVTYGVLFTVYIVGGVAADLARGWLNPRRHAGIVMVGSLLVGGVSFALAGVVPPVLVMSALLSLFIGLFSNAYVSAKYAFLRGSVDPNKLGRVTSNLYLFPGISGALRVLMLGVVAGSLSPILFGLVLGSGPLGAGALAVVLRGVKASRY